MTEFFEYLRDTVHAYVSGEIWQQFVGNWIIFQIVAVAVVLVVVAIPLWWLWSITATRRRMHVWRRAEATVVGFDTHRDHEKESSVHTETYTMKYEYTDPFGRPQQGQAFREDKPYAGQELTVYVNPQQGEKSIAPEARKHKASYRIQEVIGYLIVVAAVLVGLNEFLSL